MVAILDPRMAALLAFGAALALIAGAFAFEHLGGLAPCPLCLWQRWPYYIGVPVAALAAFGPPPWRAPLLGLVAAIFAVSAGLGTYHAGVEYGFWAGPAACAGGAGGVPGSVEDLLAGLDGAGIVRCDQAPWSLFGISLAGYNALFSAAIAGLAAAAAAKGARA